jgi:hypothetical protein
VTGTSFEDVGVVNGTATPIAIRTCPTQVPRASGTPRAGASVDVPERQRRVAERRGDHDAIADNCELATVQLNLVNDGNVR